MTGHLFVDAYWGHPSFYDVHTEGIRLRWTHA